MQIYLAMPKLGRMEPLACEYKFDGKNLIANLETPVFGLATGQALVIYDGDRVVGSGTICETI